MTGTTGTGATSLRSGPRKLRAVPDAAAKAIDIHALNRADLPGPEHWRSVWERKGTLVDFADRPRRGWRG